MHRDVSVGNIMIVDQPRENKYTGFLHDYDFSVMDPDLYEKHDDTRPPSSPSSWSSISPSSGSSGGKRAKLAPERIVRHPGLPK